MRKKNSNFNNKSRNNTKTNEPLDKFKEDSQFAVKEEFDPFNQNEEIAVKEEFDPSNRDKEIAVKEEFNLSDEEYNGKRHVKSRKKNNSKKDREGDHKESNKHGYYNSTKLEEGYDSYEDDYSSNEYDYGQEEDTETDDSYEDPYENMSMEELKNKLPPYLFMNDEEKRVFMTDLSEKYTVDINNAEPFPKKKDKQLGVKFDLDKNETHYFEKFSSLHKSKSSNIYDKEKQSRR